jgi:predicted RND superfamily exporter protein
MTRTLSQTYRYLLGFPKSILTIFCCLTLIATWQIRNFTFDASSDTLVVQGDPKLAVYFEMTELFGGDEFLVLTYSRQAKNALFSENSLARLNALQADLEALQGVKDVFSLLDAPLVKSPPVAIEDMSKNYKTLRSPDVDRLLAKEELISSPLFNNFLISSDGESSVIQINLERDFELENIRRQRD